MLGKNIDIISLSSLKIILYERCVTEFNEMLIIIKAIKQCFQHLSTVHLDTVTNHNALLAILE